MPAYVFLMLALAWLAWMAPFYEMGLVDRNVRNVVTKSPMPYGVKAARPVLETITQYVHEQGLCERRVALEILTGIKRAGADLILTYHARDVAGWLHE